LTLAIGRSTDREETPWPGSTTRSVHSSKGADEHIDMLAKKFLGADTYPFRRSDQTRLKVTITPESISGIGFSEP
jgi:hypothetical protein